MKDKDKVIIDLINNSDVIVGFINRINECLYEETSFDDIQDIINYDTYEISKEDALDFIDTNFKGLYYLYDELDINEPINVMEQPELYVATSINKLFEYMVNDIFNYLLKDSPNYLTEKDWDTPFEIDNNFVEYSMKCLAVDYDKDMAQSFVDSFNEIKDYSKTI